MENIDESVRVYDERLEKLYLKLEDGFPPDRVHSLIDETQKRKDKLSEIAKQGLMVEREFGRIFATSGDRLHASKCRLDWGLVVVDEGRIGENRVSVRMTMKTT